MSSKTQPIQTSEPEGPRNAVTASRDGVDHASEPAPQAPESPPSSQRQSKPSKPPKPPKKTLFERVEAFVSKLSTRNKFWNRVCSMIWLPYAYRSGITMSGDETTYRATLPFRRFNKNWYNAMAGAALLGNSEIAGGNYVFSVCGGDYTVVCKHLEYKFLRPCHGPAEYRMTPLDDIHALVATGEEFNISIRMDIVQVLVPMSERRLAEELDETKAGARKPKRVGRCTATFHVTPKAHHKVKKQRRTDKA